MLIYSKKIIQFANEIQFAVKNILAKEIRLKVFGSRFYNLKQTASFPIKVVIYNDRNMLGYFDRDFYELGFHERLLYGSRHQLHNVIRHELAHYLTFINHGDIEEPHSSQFRAFCKEMRWGEEVSRATLCLEEGALSPESQESPILRKVKKLMALSKSSNANEAELAMIKSQQMLLKHNIELKDVHEDEEKVVLQRILKQKKKNAKMSAIGRILETFFVNIVYNRGSDYTYLEVLGSAVNVEIAEYVAAVLDKEFESLWNQAKKTSGLKGMVAKNSFFFGIARGYCNKIKALKREYTTDISNALMVIEKMLVDAKEMVYPRLSIARSYGSHCATSAALGEQIGRQLNITPALTKAKQGIRALIGY